MLNSKLTYLLKAFSPQEFRSFGKYISSGYFNSKEKVYELYNVIRQFYPEFDNRKLTEEYLYGKLYPDREYSVKTIRNISSTMIKLAESYLCCVACRKSPFDRTRRMIEEMQKRDLTKHLETKLTLAKSLLETSKLPESNYFYNLYDIGCHERNFREAIYKSDKRKNLYLYIEKEANEFSVFMLISTLRYIIMLMNIGFNDNSKFDNSFILNTLSYLDKNIIRYEHITIVKIFYNTILLNQGRMGEADFNVIRNFIKKNIECLSDKDRGLVFAALINYIKTRCAKGCDEYCSRCFGIMKDMIDYDAYLKEGKYMSHDVYINIGVTSILGNEPNWAEKFLNKYKSEVKPSLRENSYLFCTGVLEYKKRNFLKAIETFSKVKTQDISLHLRLKVYLSKCYYEVNCEENLGYTLDSFKHILSNNVYLTEAEKTKYNNFLKYFCRLFSLRKCKEETNVEKFINDLHSAGEIENKSWLIEKAFELEQSTVSAYA